MNTTGKQIQQIEAALVQYDEVDDGKRLPAIAEFPMISLAIEQVLKGTSAMEIKELLNREGWTCGMNGSFGKIAATKSKPPIYPSTH